MTNYKTAAERIRTSLESASKEDAWHKHGEGYGSLRMDMERLADELTGKFDNPGTVVVPMVEINGGLLLVRRKLADGYGKLALPGGYQSIGETWQEAGAREVLEETGIKIDPKDLIVVDVATVQDGTVNLIFCSSMMKASGEPKAQEDEVLEVVIAKKAPDPAEIAFPTHATHIARWFQPFTGMIPADNHD